MINKDFDDFSTKLYDIIAETRDEMKEQYHRFVQLENKISSLCGSFIDLQMKYGMDDTKENESETGGKDE